MDAEVVVVDDVNDDIDVDVDVVEDDKDSDWPLLAVLIHGCRSGYRVASSDAVNGFACLMTTET